MCSQCVVGILLHSKLLHGYTGKNVGNAIPLFVYVFEKVCNVVMWYLKISNSVTDRALKLCLVTMQQLGYVSSIY